MEPLSRLPPKVTSFGARERDIWSFRSPRSKRRNVMFYVATDRTQGFRR
ncbi:hypothetical protein [Lysobacter gummosus]